MESKVKVPFSNLPLRFQRIHSEIESALDTVLKRQQFIKGPQVDQFETQFARFTGSRFCVSVHSGTDALILGIRALGIGPGDEVIVPVNTFIATALGASENGAKPVFVDIDKSDFGIAIDDLSRKITSRTKAIICVHLYGQPDKISEIQSVIHKSGKSIYLIEDAAQAHGAIYGSKHVGNYGEFGAFSFYPGKNLGAYGDGGAIITQNKCLSDKIRMLGQYGQKVKYHHEITGINSRLDTIQAAVLLIQLPYLRSWNTMRQQIAEKYLQSLADLSNHLILPKVFSQRRSVYHQFVITTAYRDMLMHYLMQNQITTMIHYPVPLHLQPAYSYLNYHPGDFPVAEKTATEILSLPIYPELSIQKIKYIITKINEFINHQK
jgi:dTDP-4-amino-4,6-dideoxygalactose transaminase